MFNEIEVASWAPKQEPFTLDQCAAAVGATTDPSERQLLAACLTDLGYRVRRKDGLYIPAHVRLPIPAAARKYADYSEMPEARRQRASYWRQREQTLEVRDAFRAEVTRVYRDKIDRHNSWTDEQLGNLIRLPIHPSTWTVNQRTAVREMMRHMGFERVKISEARNQVLGWRRVVPLTKPRRPRIAKPSHEVADFRAALAEQRRKRLARARGTPK